MKRSNAQTEPIVLTQDLHVAEQEITLVGDCFRLASGTLVRPNGYRVVVGADADPTRIVDL